VRFDAPDRSDEVHITLIGGGWDEHAQPAIYDAFLREASAVAARRSVWPGRSSFSTRAMASTSTAPASSALGSAGGVEPVVVPVRLGDQMNVDDLAEADGLLVGGGLPEYAASLVPVRDDLIRWLVERGAPCAGSPPARQCRHARRRRRVAPPRAPDLPRACRRGSREVAVVAGSGSCRSPSVADGWETTPRLRAAIADLGEGHVDTRSTRTPR
jgi:hypothetical protein